METIPLSKLPQALLEGVCQEICNFTIGLVKLHGSDPVQGAGLGGSGTLVQIDQQYGILTASHVLDYLNDSVAIGLILANATKPSLHAVKVRCETMRWLRIEPADDKNQGPDLAILTLASVDVGTVGAVKSFYNLPKREWLLDRPPALNEGIWFLAGFVDEYTSERQPDRGYSRIIGFRGACGRGWVDKQYRIGNFDYLDFEVTYGGVNDPPQSFGGTSGGGLWQVPLVRTPGGDLKPQGLLLSGVAFYQSPIIENRRVIRCHGRDGVYAHVIQRVKKELT
jgi:hypothetical protein